MKNNIYFITFGSHDNYIKAGERLIDQATNLKIFDKIKLFTLEDLKKIFYFGTNTKILFYLIKKVLVTGFGNHI
jgi:hypothetical protein